MTDQPAINCTEPRYTPATNCRSANDYDSIVTPTNGGLQEIDGGEDLTRLIRCFEAIARVRSQFERRFHLNRIAGFHGLPKSEARKLFELWQVEQGFKSG